MLWWVILLTRERWAEGDFWKIGINKEERIMKKIGKILLSILVVVAIVSFMFPSKDVKAASYPLVIVETYCGSVGETVPVVLYYSPAYNYEKLEVAIYNDKGTCVATCSKDFDNRYSSSIKYFTVDWNTTGYSAGKYTVEVTTKFYSLYSWHEAPTKTKGYVELYDDLNNGMSKNNYSGTESHFTCVQDGLQNGLLNDVTTSFTAWREVSANYQKEEGGEMTPYTIRLQEMYIGEEANTIVRKENQFNMSADSSSNQWILMKYQITNNGSSEIKASNIITSKMIYKYTGNKMTVCETAAFSGDRKDSGVNAVTIASGETKETWFGILVPISQGMPYLKIQNGYENYSYLNVNPDKATTSIVTEISKPTEEPTIEPTETPKPQPTVSQNPTNSNTPNGTTKPTMTVEPFSTEKNSSIATNFSTISAKKSSLTLKWKKKSVTGYEIQYSTNSKFKGAKKIVIKSRNTTTKKITRLAKNKKYYLRIRTYTKIKENEKTMTVYSDWSKTKTKKTKK